MTDCPNGEVRDALPDYLHDHLEPARRRQVESHLAGCEVCRDELSLLRAMRATMGRAPVVDAKAIAAAIPPYRAPEGRSWAMGWRAAAAVVALVVGGTSIALLRGRAPAAHEDTRPYVQTATAPPRVPETAVVAPPPGVAAPPSRTAASGRPAATVRNSELALGGGSITELSDGELSALVEGIESLDAVPLTEVEGDVPMSLGREEES
jgi:anti-sigma factor RsiW